VVIDVIYVNRLMSCVVIDDVKGLMSCGFIDVNIDVMSWLIGSTKCMNSKVVPLWINPSL
jgi:hypothetical protein